LFTKIDGRNAPAYGGAPALDVAPGIPVGLTPLDWRVLRLWASESATEESCDW
jgi:hypothetical protein